MEIKKSAIYERLMIFFAAVVQVIGFIISITTEDFSKATLPYLDIIIPIINISCAVDFFFSCDFYKIPYTAFSNSFYPRNRNDSE